MNDLAQELRLSNQEFKLVEDAAFQAVSFDTASNAGFFMSVLP